MTGRPWESRDAGGREPGRRSTRGRRKTDAEPTRLSAIEMHKAGEMADSGSRGGGGGGERETQGSCGLAVRSQRSALCPRTGRRPSRRDLCAAPTLRRL